MTTIPDLHRTDCKCGTKFCKHNKAQVWSCGGGTQSCAIAALIVQGKLPKPDFSVIADTGRETQATWDYFENVLQPAFMRNGMRIFRIESEKWSRSGIRLFHNTTCKDPIIPCFTDGRSSDAKMMNHCTGRWKVEVIDKWLREIHDLKRSQVVKWIGFSIDEPRRYFKMMDGDEYKDGLLRFPLVFDVRLRRYECVKLVADFGWPRPPRSACWMCPNHSPVEWKKLKDERPEEFQKAVELEREMKKTMPEVWLHRSCVPLDQVDFSQPEDLFSRPCDSGMCFV